MKQETFKQLSLDKKMELYKKYTSYVFEKALEKGVY